MMSEIDDAGDIEDEADAAVPHDGAAGSSRNGSEGWTEALNDDLLLPKQFIDEKAATALVVVDNDKKCIGRIGGVGSDVEELVESDKGEKMVADHAEFATGLNGGKLLWLWPNALFDIGDGNDIAFRSDLDDQSVDDGESEWKANGEGGTFAFNRGDINSSAKCLNIFSHDIHADSATRDVGNLLRSRQTGMKDQAKNVLIGELLVGADDSSVHRFAQNPFFAKTFTVVDNFDNDTAALLAGFQFNSAGGGFSGGGALGGCFDSMVGGVAHHVDERIADGFNDIAVEFGVTAVEVEFDFFAGFPGEISHEPGHFLEDALNGDHAHRHAEVLEFAGDFSEVGHVAVKALFRSGDAFEVLARHGLTDDQFTDGVDQLIKAVGCDFDGFSVFRFGLGSGGHWSGGRFFDFMRYGRGRRRLRDIFGRLWVAFFEKFAIGRWNEDAVDGIDDNMETFHEGYDRGVAGDRGSLFTGMVERGEKAFHGIYGFEHKVKGFTADLHLALPREVEEIFSGMGEGSDLLQIEESGDSLDRMESAKNRVNGFEIVGRGIEFQKFGFGGFKMGVGFGDKFQDQRDIVI